MKSLFTCNAFHGRQLHSRYISFVRDVNQVKNTPLLEVLGEKVCCNCIGSTRNALSDTFCDCQLGGRHIDFGIRATIEKKEPSLRHIRLLVMCCREGKLIKER